MSDQGKRAAAIAAAELVEPGMHLGIGTGSTVAHFLDALAAKDIEVAGVPTSEATANRCRELGIALLDPVEVAELDLVVDGADELDDALTLTKGGGGALLREKVVANLGRRFVVIATDDKHVARLADTFPLPIEVVPFALGPVRRSLDRRGFHVDERTESGAPYRTDNHNAVLDVRCPGGLDDPPATELELSLLPGVVCTGLFVGLAGLALLGDARGGLTELRPAG